jgi:GDP-4-dehydro-6-deoxy-D-mannose reductase
MRGADAGLRIVVTGGAGFIGSAVVSRALEAGHAVTALIRDCEPVPTTPGLSTRVVGWDDRGGLTALLADLAPDVVVHCAGSSARAQESPAMLYDANVALVWTLLSAVAASCPACGVVLLSSAAVYGPCPSVPTAETAPLDPRTHYAHSKVLAEGVASAFFKVEGVRTVVARPFNVLGPAEPTGSVVERIAGQIAGAPGPVAQVHLREVASIRDFVDVEDVADALLVLGAHGEAGGVYNVCSGVGVSIGDLVRHAANARGLSAELQLERPDEPGSVSVGDPARLMSLGWEPRLTIEESMRRIVSRPAR